MSYYFYEGRENMEVIKWLGENWFSIALLFFIQPAIKGLGKAIENGIAKQPQYKHEIAVTERNILSQKEIQVDNFYRNISSEEMIGLLGKWVSVLSNPKSSDMTEVDMFQEQMDKLIKLASGKSIKIFAEMQQYTFNNGEKLDAYQYFAFVSLLVVQLKEDFTGQEVDPLDLLKSKLKDYKVNEQKWNKAISEAKSVCGIA